MFGACLARLLRDEDGGVAIDWVALAGAMIGLAVLVVLHVAEGAKDVSAGVGAELGNSHISDITFLLHPSEQAVATGGDQGGAQGP
ncbi:hypothetical protein Rumeso_03850 [Rubellimicrobium mesophilum DSM 19309]|uniref:Uncharacterized protein n=1 Tax=Rubellimicrobium mesophilum DSM 19309 TaxID=442562 RepID=A0A017HLC9_9RHOB|nr:hypothetical protein [Rubellimicrobium mesophilum]EYD74554.1 hypothetical protein Rumeso_03850 [Rubellimicrobium mesophilum DSM 19309]